VTVYATTDQFRLAMQQLSAPSAAMLARMEEILEGVSKQFDNFCRRDTYGLVAGVAGTARYYSADGEAHLRIHQNVEVTEVAVKASMSAVDYDVWTAPTALMAGDGDYVVCRGDVVSPTYGTTPYDLLLIDINGEFSIFCAGVGIPTVRVTARWGPYATTPDDIREACIMQAIRWYKKESASMSSRSSSESLGQITHLRKLDNDVKLILVDGGYVVPLYGNPG